MSRIETMNRKGIKEHCFGLADWKPSNSAAANRLMNGFVNRGLLELAKDVPFLFDEALIQTPVYMDITPQVTSDTFETTVDPWVLKMTLPATDPNATPWEEDVDWDGRPIHLKSATDGQWHLRTIREAWIQTVGGVSSRFVTLTRPYPNTSGVTITDIDWKIFAHVVRLPSDVIRVKTCHMLRDGISYPLEFQFQGTAEAHSSIRPGQLLPTGPPRKLFRRPPSHLEAPAYTPTTSINEVGVWIGERPRGKFEYCFTYVWGRGEAWDTTGGPTTNALQSIDSTRQVPWLESPPSGVSNEIDLETAGTGVITLPNHDRMMGFNDPATLRYGRTGFRKRIYVRRLTDPSGTAEIQESFYLLDEVEGDILTYSDNGSKLPDLGAPLLDNHMFQHLEMYPPPDQRYDLMLRVTLAPPRLENPSAAPRIPEMAMEAYLCRIMMYLYESMGNTAMKANVTNDYALALQAIRKNYGLGKPANIPRSRKPARVRSRRGRRRRFVYSEDPIS